MILRSLIFRRIFESAQDLQVEHSGTSHLVLQHWKFCLLTLFPLHPWLKSVEDFFFFFKQPNESLVRGIANYRVIMSANLKMQINKTLHQGLLVTKYLLHSHSFTNRKLGYSVRRHICI